MHLGRKSPFQERFIGCAFFVMVTIKKKGYGIGWIKFNYNILKILILRN